MGKKSFTNMGVKGRCTKHHSRGNVAAEVSQDKKYKNQISVGIISSHRCFFSFFFFSQFESVKKLLVDSSCLYTSLSTC